MPLTVRCPGCSTRFKVANDQLRIASGRVRCGVCRQVFDAAQQLGQRAAEEAALPAAGASDQLAQDESRPVGTRRAADAAMPLLRRASSDASGSDWDLSSAAAATGDVSKPAATRSVDRTIGSTTRGAPLEAAATTGYQSVSFLRHGHQDHREAPKAWRWLLNLAVLLAIFILLAQLMLQQRDSLVVQAPALRPVLQALCRPLGCTVGPPRQIGALVIGNSSLTRMGDAGYRLSLALRNQADTDLATPSVELTLTDPAERTLVRRVLMPDDLAAGPSIAARGEWAGALTFTLTDPGARLAGYRVIAFYP